MRSRPSRRFLEGAGTAGSVLAAGLCFHSLFGLSALWISALIVCAGTAVVCGFGRRLPWWAVWPVSALILLGVLWWAGDHPGRAAPAFYRGWGELLDTTLPVSATAANLAVPLTVLWAGTAAAVRMALRSPGRLTPLLPSFAVFALAMCYSAAEPEVNLVPAAFLAAAVIVFVILRRPHARGRAARARISGALTVCAVLPVAALATAPGTLRPHDFRAGRSVSLIVRDEVNPLSRVSEWLLRSDELFTVEGGGDGEPFRLTVFDSYDGLRWSTSASFLRTGKRIPAQDAVTGDPAKRTIRLAGLRGRWLPSGGWPDHLSANALVDPETGVLAMREPVEEGFSYDLWTRPRRAPNAAEIAEFQRLPLRPDGSVSLPARLAVLGEKAAASASGRYDFAEALEKILGEECATDDHARPGHTLGRLASFCTAGDGGTGTSEQFATAYALIAHSRGIQTRVVLGFSAPGKGRSLVGSMTVRSDDVLVWPEVLFPGFGWVAFSPTPGTPGSGVDTSAHADATPSPSPSSHRAESPKKTPSPTATPKPPKPSDISEELDERGSSWPRALLIFALLLLVYPSAAVVLAWAAVLRARGAGPPQARISAAWLYATRPLGWKPSRTPGKALAEARTAGLDPELLRPLAELVNASLYLRHAPTFHDAATAWTHALAFRKAISWFSRFRPREAAFHLRLALRPLHRPREWVHGPFSRSPDDPYRRPRRTFRPRRRDPDPGNPIPSAYDHLSTRHDIAPSGGNPSPTRLEADGDGDDPRPRVPGRGTPRSRRAHRKDRSRR